VPFKDFKGNINEAINKLMGDLRKFGYADWKNLKLEQIS